jgi:hypothetical protein
MQTTYIFFTCYVNILCIFIYYANSHMDTH